MDRSVGNSVDEKRLEGAEILNKSDAFFIEMGFESLEINPNPGAGGRT